MHKIEVWSFFAWCHYFFSYLAQMDFFFFFLQTEPQAADDCLEAESVVLPTAYITDINEGINITEIMACIIKKLTLHLANPHCHK